MNDTQILVLSLSIVIPLSMLIFSNSRISDVNKRIDDLRSDILLMKKELKDHVDNAFQHMELLLKIHESEHHNKGGK